MSKNGQRRIWIGIATLLLICAGLAARPRRGQAIQTFVQKAKSDCASIEANITLAYNRDDVPNLEDENRDYFILEVYDGDTGAFLTSIEESITDEQSPFYWQTNRIETATLEGLYNLRLSDTNAEGEKEGVLESYFFDCTNNTRWWDTSAVEAVTAPNPECLNTLPVYTTNRAPEDGAVLIMWSWEPSYTAIDYHVDTLRVNEGTLFTYDEFPVPCGVYIKLYYQPDSTKLLYLMPSQYWPYDAYGTSPVEAQRIDEVPVYNTVFPLDGEERQEGEAIPRSPFEGESPPPTPDPCDEDDDDEDGDCLPQFDDNDDDGILECDEDFPDLDDSDEEDDAGDTDDEDDGDDDEEDECDYLSTDDDESDDEDDESDDEDDG